MITLLYNSFIHSHLSPLSLSLNGRLAFVSAQISITLDGRELQYFYFCFRGYNRTQNLTLLVVKFALVISVCMDNLLCDEVWLSSSENSLEVCAPIIALKNYENEEFQEAFALSLEKELSYMHEPHYSNYLHSNNLIFPRCKVIQWFIKCGSRFNLSFGTVFWAVNYLDRFVCICQCHDWKYWMLELLAIACLSIATKFNEVSGLSLHEIQMEDLDYSFQSNVILRMEMILLKALGWRLNSVTSYSFGEMLACNVQNLGPHLYENLISPVTELLFQATLDQKMLEFRPSIVGISALWCTLDQLFPSISNTYIAYIMRLLNQSQKDDIIKCHELMGTQTSLCSENYHCGPLSPTTVLLNTTRIYDS